MIPECTVCYCSVHSGSQENHLPICDYKLCLEATGDVINH